ncbi:L-arabinose isomerase [Labilibaculum manganireducens]|uniref:L-arabinose isomerase n=1 Tax=Labilibaculum manganireducens TaxID=1940525 RepID=A0A2N3IAL0_9BACT|nr:L-arabinose isomerase [Labilibaculum manganireducens]PKQ67283.1 L-arabinose isomerase [Labilibaculum manganireducens]
MKELKEKEIWFVTGSQHLYGPETLKQVKDNSEEIAEGLNASDAIPVKIVFKSVLTTPDEIYNCCLEANTDNNCIGLITWMHTFSPSKMWIQGLSILSKPFAHLHTQYNRDIPWSEIDMDFMNLNQSAHGGREFGFICTRLRLNRKVIVGHWKDEKVRKTLGSWTRSAVGYNESKNLKICRFGDNMRHVAVTEGDKVEAQKILGWQVNYHGVGDLVVSMDSITEQEIDSLMDVYAVEYKLADKTNSNIRYQAKIELGMKKFLDANGYKAFTTNFEDLHGLKQLPGLASQRLMEQGYGFGAEGDWKQSALVRIMKVMSAGMKGGCSFMEDYTYHLDPACPSVLSAHMLEICPSIAKETPSIEVHPLGIGGKDAPARFVFDVPEGEGINATLVDMGGRMRMIVNPVTVITPKALPKLPVARALWVPQPNLEIGAAAWILAGGAHHTSFSMALNKECLEDFAEMVGVEFVTIENTTTISDFKKELKWNDLYYHLAKGL